MDYNQAALKMHEDNKGKISVVSKVDVKTRDDLSTAYTPGVAEPCRRIRDDKSEVYRYTDKGNLVAIFNSLGLLEIAQRESNVSQMLKLDTNSEILVECEASSGNRLFT